MAKSTGLPREIQSILHDKADELGEKIARGELVEIDYSVPYPDMPESPHLKSGDKCTCARYSQLKEGNQVAYWSEEDPNCAYMHLQPLPDAFVIKLP